MCHLRCQQANQHDDQSQDHIAQQIRFSDVPEDKSEKIPHLHGTHRKRPVKNDRFAADHFFRTLRDVHGIPGLRIGEMIVQKFIRDQRNRRPAVCHHAKHRAAGVLTPAFCQFHRPPHDPLGPQQIREYLFKILLFLRYFRLFDMIITQDLPDGILCTRPLVRIVRIQSASHDGSGHPVKGFLKILPVR